MAQSGKYGDIKTCGGGDTNYWAGAVKTCGGVDNIPSEEQLKTIVRTMYDCGEDCVFYSAASAVQVTANRNFGLFSKVSDLGGANGSTEITTSTHKGDGSVVSFRLTASFYQTKSIFNTSTSLKTICIGE